MQTRDPRDQKLNNRMLQVASLEGLFEAFCQEPWFQSIRVASDLPLSEQEKIAWFARLFNPEIRVERDEPHQFKAS